MVAAIDGRRFAHARRRPQPRIDPVSGSSDPGQTLAPAALPAGDWLAPVDGHRVWWCEGGDPAGLPVLIVHGGPGGASRLEPTRWFDGLPLRWIAIDQRGCGRSEPLGRTDGNDLDALLDDMERLRRHLGLRRWAVAGGSWGARVALAYAARWPEVLHGLLLRSPFLGTAAETRRYIAPWLPWLGAEGRAWLGEPAATAVAALYQAEPGLLHIGAMQADERIARAWSAFDDAQSVQGGVAASGARCDPAALPAATPQLMASWRIHAHYAAASWGVAAAGAAGVPALNSGVPVSVVWGAADATCDPAVARALAAALPGALSHEVPEAGHRMSDPRLAPALRAAARDWALRCRGSD